VRGKAKTTTAHRKQTEGMNVMIIVAQREETYTDTTRSDPFVELLWGVDSRSPSLRQADKPSMGVIATPWPDVDGEETTSFQGNYDS